MSKASFEDGGYARKVQEDTRRYVQDLLADNQRLHALVVGLREDLQRQVQEYGRLQRQLMEVEASSRRFSEQYVEVERQNSNLAHLYVASHRLHGTVDHQEVLGVIQEIIANLVGSEELAIFETSRDGSSLVLAASLGLDPSPYRAIPAGYGLIGRTLATGEAFFSDGRAAADEAGASAQDRNLTACIPLRLGEATIGAIAVFRLLPQKAGLQPLDHELFDLLATHAATALYCATLHAARVWLQATA